MELVNSCFFVFCPTIARANNCLLLSWFTIVGEVACAMGSEAIAHAEGTLVCATIDWLE